MEERAAKLDTLRQLTWEALEDWAGATIARRGRSYARGGQVRELACTTDGALVAWVQGTARYATLVDVEEDGPAAACTCPFGAVCKHAVAVVLVYQTAAGQRQEPPTVADTDPRLALLAAQAEDWDDDVWADDEALADQTPAAPVGNPPTDPLRVYLEGLTREELVSLLDELARRLPEVRSALEARQVLATSGAGRLVREVRALIHTVSARPGWRNSWDDEGYTPDYTAVRDRLALLLRQGYADQVVALGEDVLEVGTRQVEESHDEGETALEIARCLDFAFQALARSSLAPAEQMLRAIEWELRDEYDLCTGAAAFWEQPRTAADWRHVAEALVARLEQPPVPGARDDFVSSYRRDRLADRAIEALEQAGRHAEVIPLCEREAERNGSYVRLVQRLVAADRRVEAERWITEGVAALEAAKPGLAGQLRAIQLALWEEAGDWPRAAALRAEAFFEGPAMTTLRPLRAASERAGVWPAVRSAVLRYLETGEPPTPNERVTDRGTNPPWPLPASGLPLPAARWRPSFPLVQVLIELAADERRPDEVLRWYDRRQAGVGTASGHDHLVSEAVAEAYPERAVAIWRQLAEAQIAQTNPRAYEEAAVYLRSIGRVRARQGRTEDWRQYLGQLRQAHRRKRRLLAILDQLEAPA